jgi:hypothetical protein
MVSMAYQSHSRDLIAQQPFKLDFCKEGYKPATDYQEANMK